MGHWCSEPDFLGPGLRCVVLAAGAQVRAQGLEMEVERLRADTDILVQQNQRLMERLALMNEHQEARQEQQRRALEQEAKAEALAHAGPCEASASAARLKERRQALQSGLDKLVHSMS